MKNDEKLYISFFNLFNVFQVTLTVMIGMYVLMLLIKHIFTYLKY